MAKYMSAELVDPAAESGDATASSSGIRPISIVRLVSPESCAAILNAMNFPPSFEIDDPPMLTIVPNRNVRKYTAKNENAVGEKDLFSSIVYSEGVDTVRAFSPVTVDVLGVHVHEDVRGTIRLSVEDEPNPDYPLSTLLGEISAGSAFVGVPDFRVNPEVSQVHSEHRVPQLVLRLGQYSVNGHSVTVADVFPDPSQLKRITFMPVSPYFE